MRGSAARWRRAAIALAVAGSSAQACRQDDAQRAVPSSSAAPTAAASISAPSQAASAAPTAAASAAAMATASASSEEPRRVAPVTTVPASAGTIACAAIDCTVPGCQKICTVGKEVCATDPDTRAVGCVAAARYREHLASVRATAGKNSPWEWYRACDDALDCGAGQRCCPIGDEVRALECSATPCAGAVCSGQGGCVKGYRCVLRGAPDAHHLGVCRSEAVSVACGATRCKGGVPCCRPERNGSAQPYCVEDGAPECPGMVVGCDGPRDCDRGEICCTAAGNPPRRGCSAVCVPPWGSPYKPSP